MSALPPKADYRYTYENLQTGGFAGTDLNITGAASSFS
jgi:hypothetical protein